MVIGSLKAWIGKRQTMAIVWETSFMFCLNIMEKQNLANYHLKGHYNNLVLLLKGPEDL